MMDLNQIEVLVNDYDEDDDLDGGHLEITVGSPVTAGMEDNRLDGHPDLDIWNARRYAAGLLGRVATYAAPYMVEDGHRHGCRPVIRDPSTDAMDFPLLGRCCHISSQMVLDPNADTGGAVGLSLIVSRARTKVWLERVQVWLAAIAADEQWFAEAAARAQPDPATPPSPPEAPQTPLTPPPGLTNERCEHGTPGGATRNLAGAMRCMDCRRHDKAQALARGANEADPPPLVCSCGEPLSEMRAAYGKQTCVDCERKDAS